MPQTRKSLEPYLHDWINLYQHQLEGVNRMHKMRNALLADDMGLGKTLQTLAVFAAQCLVTRAKAERAGRPVAVQRMIVVAPLALKGNWADEIELFTTFRHVILDGTPGERNKQLVEFASIKEPCILIVNYEQVGKHIAPLNGMRFDFAAYDEAHMMKNPRSARTKACQSLYSMRSFLLTGSPMLNQADDLWVLLDKIEPNQWKNFWGFRQEYCVMGGWKNKQVMGVKNEKRLRAKLQNVMIRRLKSEVLDLPDVQYITKKVGLTPEQRKLYNQVIEDMKLTSGDSDPAVIDNDLTKFLRLKQICGTTASVLESREDHSEKLDAVVEDVITVMREGHKVVVFTQFRSVQECFMARMKVAMTEAKVDWAGFQMNGDDPGPTRVPLVKEWAAVEGPAYFCGMLQVIGVGLNMTAARHGFFIDKLFVPKLNQQAVDRMNRIGASSTQSVQIFEYLVRGTVESRVEVILKKKDEQFFTVVEDGQDSWKKRLYEALREAASNEDD